MTRINDANKRCDQRHPGCPRSVTSLHEASVEARLEMMAARAAIRPQCRPTRLHRPWPKTRNLQRQSYPPPLSGFCQAGPCDPSAQPVPPPGLQAKPGAAHRRGPPPPDLTPTKLSASSTGSAPSSSLAAEPAGAAEPADIYMIHLELLTRFSSPTLNALVERMPLPLFWLVCCVCEWVDVVVSVFTRPTPPASSTAGPGRRLSILAVPAHRGHRPTGNAGRAGAAGADTACFFWPLDFQRRQRHGFAGLRDSFRP